MNFILNKCILYVAKYTCDFFSPVFIDVLKESEFSLFAFQKKICVDQWTAKEVRHQSKMKNLSTQGWGLTPLVIFPDKECKYDEINYIKKKIIMKTVAAFLTFINQIF